MNLTDKPLLYLGLRQTESIREALNASLVGEVIDGQQFARWLKKQGAPPLEGRSEIALIRWTMECEFERQVGEHPDFLVKGSHAPDERLLHMGAERSGAGGENAANFIITSAFVRLLGAGEQFELDVLKALFYHRPSGLLGPPNEQLRTNVDIEVLLEEPVIEQEKQIFQKPVLWTWLKKHAENYVERDQIFKRVFDIDPIPDGFQSKTKKQWYEKRNSIAHGRRGVQMTLIEYCEADAFVAKSMLHIAKQCDEKLKLIL